ncbi:DHA2 family efflux MFS transporter permease subunit [Nonomuraea sp. NPDC046802]|uniref:DHA2 family efflux MFS transporter permease subunit n=1 Tax=Nonomuraea sp. NPDC046802 TaxID=3154919 RepID=UPI0033E17831
MSATALTAPTEVQPYRRRWIALFVILAAEVMDLLDALVTAIAAPTIQRELGGSDSLVQWLGAGYTLAMAVGLITGGRLGDLYGRKRMFVIGALGFTAASLVCGVSVSPEMLIAGRVLQGLFGAVMIPQGLGLIKEMFPPQELGKAFGMFGPVMTISSVGGPVLAGWLVDADFFGTGWRMIFLINLPIGLAAVLAAMRFLPEHRLSNATRLDLVGVLLVSVAAFLLVFPLIQGRELGWPAWTFVSMAASIAVFAVFGRYESRRAASGRDPLITPGLFRKRAFTGGLVAGLAFFSGLMGFGLVFSLYTQLGLGFTPLQAGLVGLPQALGGVVGFGLAMSGLQEKLGRGLLQIGTGIMAAGAAVLALTIHQAGLDVSAWQLSPGLTLVGVGMGLTMAPFFDIVLAGVEPHESGSASGTLTAVQQLGGALGTAILGTLFFNLLADKWAFGASMQVTVWVEVGLLALTFALSYLLPRRARPDGHGA